MPISYALTTKERVKAKLEITASNQDTTIDRLIASVTDFIESKCNRRFLRTTYTQEIYDGTNVDGTPKQSLILNNGPLVSISQFQYRTGLKSSPVWVDFVVDDYQEIKRLGVITLTLPSGFENIRISYTAGYLIDFTNEFDSALHTLPHELTDLAERLVIRFFKKRESEGRSIETFQGSTTTWKEFLETLDNEVIANHSRYIFA